MVWKEGTLGPRSVFQGGKIPWPLGQQKPKVIPGGDVVAEDTPCLVLLIPGWKDRETALDRMRRRFLEAGWPSEAVCALSFRDPVGSNRVHAREVAEAIHDLSRVEPGRPIHAVAHSMGGLALRLSLLEGLDGGLVRRAVFVATPHRGTWMARFAWGQGAREMRPGSDLLQELDAGDPIPERVTGLSIWTPLDTHVVPARSALLPGIPARRIPFATHRSLLRSSRSIEVVHGFIAGGEVE
jgi:triacylglycerol esterase/lipase EstA (alpha/beta hydrolase family)